MKEEVKGGAEARSGEKYQFVGIIVGGMRFMNGWMEEFRMRADVN